MILEVRLRRLASRQCHAAGSGFTYADGTTLDGWQTGNSTDDFDQDNRIAGKFIVFGGYALKAVEYGSKDSPAARTGNTGATRAVAGFHGNCHRGAGFDGKPPDRACRILTSSIKTVRTSA
ncbi:hypothetical protein P7H17_16630 [Paenibacillus larvae]|nr:hypothetical protein [Paenibacillus larvae]MDT2287334.1 hypothetical protein [Paenibacillus larvae]